MGDGGAKLVIKLWNSDAHTRHHGSIRPSVEEPKSLDGATARGSKGRQAGATVARLPAMALSPRRLSPTG